MYLSILNVILGILPNAFFLYNEKCSTNNMGFNITLIVSVHIVYLYSPKAGRWRGYKIMFLITFARKSIRVPHKYRFSTHTSL